MSLLGAENVRTLHLPSMTYIDEYHHVNLTKGCYYKDSYECIKTVEVYANQDYQMIKCNEINYIVYWIQEVIVLK